MEGLKPCPFCGSEVYISNIKTNDVSFESLYDYKNFRVSVEADIVCTGCHTKVSMLRSSRDCDVITRPIVEAWNARNDDTSLTKLRASIEVRMDDIKDEK